MELLKVAAALYREHGASSAIAQDVMNFED